MAQPLTRPSAILSPQAGRGAIFAIFIAYVLLTSVVAFHHEPWRDEADSWLVARDLQPSEFLSWVRDAGTPALWYLFILPLARGGAPYASLTVLHLLLAWSAAALFLARAPFGLLTKALLLFSFYFAFQYAVIARSYSLGILLTFALCALYPHRERHLFVYAAVVAMLYNVNAHSIGIALAASLVLFVEIVREHRNDLRWWGALSVMGTGALLSFLQLYKPGEPVSENAIAAPDWIAFQQLARAFFPSFTANFVTVFASIVLLVLVAISIRKHFAALALFTISLGMLALIFAFLRMSGFRHYGLVLIVTVGSLWLASDALPRSRVLPWAMLLLNVALAISIPMALRYSWLDITKNFSGSKEMARYLVTHDLADAEIAAHAPTKCAAVLAHLPRRTFWYAVREEYGSFVKWDALHRLATVTSPEGAAERAMRHYGSRDWLFLSHHPLARPEDYGLTLLYATHEPMVEPRDATPTPNDERYWLYRHARSAR